MKESDRYAKEKRLYLLYVDDVFRLCFYYLGNRQDAEDAVSETVIRLLENSLRLNPTNTPGTGC